MSDGNGIKPRRLCVLTMSNGADIMGDLVGDIYEGSDWVTLEHPCLLQIQPPSNLVLADLLRNSPVRSGKSVTINLRAVMMIAEPTDGLLSAYQANRAGLIIAPKLPAAINQ